MPCQDCFITIKVLKDLPDYRAGQEVKVDAMDGVPLLKFWRDRLHDAEIDRCVEVVTQTPKSKSKQEGDTK